MARLSKKDRAAIQKKIAYLIEVEKKDPKQAAAIAHSMHREGRLTQEGHYVPVKKD